MPAPILPALSMMASVMSWALSFPLITLALIEMEPIPLAATRFAIAAAISALWLAWTRPKLPGLGDTLRFLLQGLIGIAIYNFALNTGQQTVAAGAASFIVNTAPLMTMILAIIFLKDRFNVWGWIGTLLGLGGVALIGLGQPGGLSFGAGTSLILAAALCSAVYFILQKSLVATYGALPTAAITLIAGTLWLSPWLPGGVVVLTMSTPQTVAAIFGLGILSATIGYATWAYALGHYGPARAANFLYLVPPLATVLSYVLTGEIPNVFTIIGGALAIIGVILVNTRGHSQEPLAQPEP